MQYARLRKYENINQLMPFICHRVFQTKYFGPISPFIRALTSLVETLVHSAQLQDELHGGGGGGRGTPDKDFSHNMPAVLKVVSW
jgi:hypothetical protein